MTTEAQIAMARPVLLEHPERCPGTYDMHFYCKYENPAHCWDEFPHEANGCQTRGEAIAQARKMGWIIHRDLTGTCPKCASHLKGQQ